MNALDTKKHVRTNARQMALLICQQVIQQGLSLSRQLEYHLSKLSSDRDRSFCSELSFGVCRYYYVLNAELKTLLKKPLKSRDSDVKTILLLGLYQVRFMRVENHAAVNETVKLLRSTKKPWAKGLVNGILRNYVRSLDSQSTEKAVPLSPQEHGLAYPGWIRKKIESDWGEFSNQIMVAGNQRAPMVLRVDISQISRAGYLKRLQHHSIRAAAHPLIEQAVLLDKPVSVDLLPGFDKALVSVQDAAAQIAATLLGCQPGMNVLDACAAPGGKTLHMLQATDSIHMTALDKDASRLQKISENLHRSGLTARVVCADATEPDGWFDGVPFDRILLDAPCSASGIIRRHPDIRLLRRPEDIAGLVMQQQQLLDSLWPLLKPGGRLLYTTCSIFKDENENQLSTFLRSQGDCVELQVNNVQWGLERPVGRQILPGFNDMDGFYYARLEKIV